MQVQTIPAINVLKITITFTDGNSELPPNWGATVLEVS